MSFNAMNFLGTYDETIETIREIFWLDLTIFAPTRIQIHLET